MSPHLSVPLCRLSHPWQEQGKYNQEFQGINEWVIEGFQVTVSDSALILGARLNMPNTLFQILSGMQASIAGHYSGLADLLKRQSHGVFSVIRLTRLNDLADAVSVSMSFYCAALHCRIGHERALNMQRLAYACTMS